MIISIDAEKAFDKIHHPFMIKTPKKWAYMISLQQTLFSVVKVDTLVLFLESILGMLSVFHTRE